MHQCSGFEELTKWRLFKQGHLERVSQDNFQVTSEDPQGGDLTASLGVSEQSLAPSSLHPPFRDLGTRMRSP